MIITESEVDIRGTPWRYFISKHAVNRWNRTLAPESEIDSKGEIRERIRQVMEVWKPVYSYLPPEQDFTLPAGDGRHIVCKLDPEERLIVAVTVLLDHQVQHREGRIRFRQDDLDSVRDEEDVAVMVLTRCDIARWEMQHRR